MRLIKKIMDKRRRRDHAQVVDSLSWSIENGDEAQIGSLLCGSHAGLLTSFDRGTALAYAIRKERLDLARLMVDRGFDINASSNSDATALETAVIVGNRDLVSGVLELGADINKTDGLGNSPLTWAAGKLDLDMVELLMANGAAICCRDVALLGDIEALQVPIDPRVDLNVLGLDGYSLLHLAVMNGHVETVRILLDMGSDVNIEIDSDNAVALDLILPHTRVISLGVLPLLYAIAHQRISAARRLIESGEDVNCTCAPGSGFGGMPMGITTAIGAAVWILPGPSEREETNADYQASVDFLRHLLEVWPKSRILNAKPKYPP